MNSVCDTPRSQAERIEQPRVQRRERRGRRVVGGKRPGHEDAAFVRDRHRRRPIAAGEREDDAPIEDERIDVEDVAGHELLEQVVGTRVAKRVERVPELVGVANLADANRGRL